MRQDGPTTGISDTHSPSEDVAQRQRTEALRWRSVFDNSATGVALADLSGRLVATNSTYQKMLGYTESECRELSFLDITHESYREANWALVQELLEGKRDQFQIEKQYLRKDGTLIWVRNNVSLVPDTETTPPLILALGKTLRSEKKQKRLCKKVKSARV